MWDFSGLKNLEVQAFAEDDCFLRVLGFRVRKVALLLAATHASSL